MLGFSLVVASGDYSSLQYMGFSLWWLLLLQSMGSRRAGSVVVAHGLCSLMACGIFPDQGLNPCPLHWQADSLPLSHQGSPFFGFDIKVMLANRISWGMSSLLLVSKTISERLGYFFFMYLVELISDDIWTPKFSIMDSISKNNLI